MNKNEDEVMEFYGPCSVEGCSLGLVTGGLILTPVCPVHGAQVESETRHDVDVCQDCYMAAAGVLESEEGLDPAPLARWAGEGVVLIVPGDDEEGHFSWRDCEGCGSRLGGDRFWVVIFVREGVEA